MGASRYPPRRQYTRSLAVEPGSKKTSGSQRSRGTSLVQSREARTLSQNDNKSRAPGNRHAIPMIAMSSGRPDFMEWTISTIRGSGKAGELYKDMDKLINRTQMIKKRPSL